LMEDDPDLAGLRGKDGYKELIRSYFPETGN